VVRPSDGLLGVTSLTSLGPSRTHPQGRVLPTVVERPVTARLLTFAELHSTYLHGRSRLPRRSAFSELRQRWLAFGAACIVTS
jgi:hypothetical protein